MVLGLNADSVLVLVVNVDFVVSSDLFAVLRTGCGLVPGTGLLLETAPGLPLVTSL